MTYNFHFPEIERMGATFERRRQLRLKKAKAAETARAFVKKHKISKDPCVCGREKVQMHHVDYDQPLLIVFLCQRCHLRSHIKRLPNLAIPDPVDLHSRVPKKKKLDLGIRDALAAFGYRKVRHVRREYAAEPSPETVKRLASEFTASYRTIRNVLKGLKRRRS